MDQKERNKNALAIMAAILLLPKVKELNDSGPRNSPKWAAALEDAVRMAEQIMQKIESRYSRS